MSALDTTIPVSVIHKPSHGGMVAPTLPDYDEARRGFSWNAVRQRELDGLPGGRGLNIAHEAVDRHLAKGAAQHCAIRWIGRSGERRELSYGNLAELASRFANVLEALGVHAGERVFALSDRIPELYAAALGTLKHRAVFCPLFSAFGPEPIRARLSIGAGSVLVTTPTLYRRKVALIRDALPELRQVLLVGEPNDVARIAGAKDLRALMAVASAFTSDGVET